MAVRQFDVSIRGLNSGQTHIVAVSSNMNVGEVKRLFSERAGIDPAQFSLVFAGQKLDDSNRLETLGLMGYSTLHCIRGRGGVQVAISPASPSLGTSMAGVENTLADVTHNQNQGEGVQQLAPSTPTKDVTAHRNRFFIYCKDVCNEMKPGKLRVRCSSCRDESFVLSRGPDSWDDVLTKNRIEGTCHREDCQGTQFAEFFFKCGGHDDRVGGGNQYMALHMIRANTVEVPCAVCGDVSETVIRFDCNHCMCVDCFTRYCTVNVTSRSFREVRAIGYTILCPDHCDQSEVKEIHHFQLMGKELYERYKNFAAEEFVLQMGGVLCPAASCGAGIMLEDDNRRIQCPTCRYLFCKRCKSPFHQGDCTQASQGGQANTEGVQFDQARLQQGRWNDESERYIQENTGIKPCPGCHAPIEKTHGCNHMSCSRCRFQFCWLCLIEWSRNCQDSHWFRDSL